VAQFFDSQCSTLIQVEVYRRIQRIRGRQCAL